MTSNGFLENNAATKRVNIGPEIKTNRIFRGKHKKFVTIMMTQIIEK
jgi:hypothetical protein